MAVVVRSLAKWYTGKLGARLSKLGLTYHDVVSDTGVFDTAISRLPDDLKLARQRRMKRAQDLSSKHAEIPEAQRENPWREYTEVSSVLSETQKEADEAKHLAGTWWMPYHIGRESWFAYDTKKAWFWQPAKPIKRPGGGPQ